MGLIANIVAGGGAVGSLTRAAQGLSQVFVPNATEGQRLDHEGRAAALEQLSEEFSLERRSSFDRFMDGLNRLPRPMLALGTLGLFIYSMAEPVGFGLRMQGLSLVPEPLWWLLGAIVGFYFGARELHYLRPAPPPVRVVPETVVSAWRADALPEALPTDALTGGLAGGPGDAFAEASGENAALRDWQGKADQERAG